jgi:hypothetical protein
MFCLMPSMETYLWTNTEMIDKIKNVEQMDKYKIITVLSR